MGTKAFEARFTPTTTAKGVVQHLNNVIATYNKLAKVDLNNLEGAATYVFDPAKAKHHLCCMFNLDEAIFAPEVPRSLKAVDQEVSEDDAESETSHKESLKPIVKTPTKKPSPVKTPKSDVAKGKQKVQGS
jgi:hypothetical protein